MLHGCLEYTFCETPFGECLVVATSRGIRRLEFDVASPDEVVGALRTAAATEPVSSSRLGRQVQAVFADPAGRLPALELLGTDFQIQVWRALLSIRPGCTLSYRQVAERIGRPSAVRAVANAIARNPVSFIVPCHRVVRADGRLGGYRWGAARKRAMLDWEATLRISA